VTTNRMISASAGAATDPTTIKAVNPARQIRLIRCLLPV
jgi:hypothetical protein